MTPTEELRREYLQRVCAALGEYLDHGDLKIHSELRGSELEIAFTIDKPDVFHNLMEDHGDLGSDASPSNRANNEA